jgi:hypothetical protein
MINVQQASLAILDTILDKTRDKRPVIVSSNAGTNSCDYLGCFRLRVINQPEGLDLGT